MNDWLAAHDEAMRREAAAEALREETARLNAALLNTHLEFAHAEAARAANATQFCPSHGIPTTIPGTCQLCIADGQASAAIPPSGNEIRYDLGDRPSARAPTTDTGAGVLQPDQAARPVETAPAAAAVAGGRRETGRDGGLLSPVAREPARGSETPDTRHRPVSAEHAKVRPLSSGRQPGHGAGHTLKRVSPEDRRPPKRDPDRAPSGHPRGSIEFYCGNCCTLSFTPGYCTACGAMLKALDAAGDRPRQSGDHDHHLLPSEFDRSMLWKDRDINLLPSQFDQSIGFWKDLDINRNDFCVTLPPEYHRQVHALWNDEWAWFIMDHPDATREQIRAQMYAMMEDYELDQFKIHGYRRKE